MTQEDIMNAAVVIKDLTKVLFVSVVKCYGKG